MKKFIVGRIRSLYFAIKGMFLLFFTEDAIIAQTITSSLLIIMGFYFGLTKMEWLIQLMFIGLILVAESLNTAVEKLCDFIHPDHHEKIGFIKDIAAGAVSFAVFTAIIGSVIIYYPYVKALFI